MRGATTYRPRSSLAMRAIERKFSVISRSEILRSNSASTASMRLTGRARRDCSGKDRHQGDGAGRIVNVGAMGAIKAAAGMGAYAASKAGVAKLTEALADELKDRGITVNAIMPSTLDTPRNRADMPQADFTRWVAPVEAAEVIAFLVSDAARAVTGALIPVAGRV